MNNLVFSVKIKYNADSDAVKIHGEFVEINVLSSDDALAREKAINILKERIRIYFEDALEIIYCEVNFVCEVDE